jgi:hypothetical protein
MIRCRISQGFRQSCVVRYHLIFILPFASPLFSISCSLRWAARHGKYSLFTRTADYPRVVPHVLVDRVLRRYLRLVAAT